MRNVTEDVMYGRHGEGPAGEGSGGESTSPEGEHPRKAYVYEIGLSAELFPLCATPGAAVRVVHERHPWMRQKFDTAEVEAALETEKWWSYSWDNGYVVIETREIVA